MSALTKISFLFLFISGLFIISSCEKKEEDTKNTVTDIDGNVYKTVTIGSQVWMAENLKVTSFNDDRAISNVTGNSDWGNLITPAYCLYNNDPNKKDSIGAMYNWYAVNSGKLCPTGWHVPKDSDFIDLELYLGLPQDEIHQYGWHGNNQGAQLKSTTDWIGGGNNATNSSKFSALPAGYRQTRIGVFSGLGTITILWTSSDDSQNGKPAEVWYRRLDATESRIFKGTTTKSAGNYVRCLKNQ